MEESRKLDVRSLRRRDLLPDPDGDSSARVRRTLRYGRPMFDAPAYVSLVVGPHHLEVQYAFRGEMVVESVVLLRDTKNVTRTFLACPQCGGRRELLYLLDSIACRQCHRLRWTTNLLSPTDRAIYRCQKLQALTGVPPGVWGAFDGLPVIRPPWLTPVRWKAINAEYVALAEKTIGNAVADVEESVAAFLEAHGLTAP